MQEYRNTLMFLNTYRLPTATVVRPRHFIVFLLCTFPLLWVNYNVLPSISLLRSSLEMYNVPLLFGKLAGACHFCGMIASLTGNSVLPYGRGFNTFVINTLFSVFVALTFSAE